MTENKLLEFARFIKSKENRNLKGEKLDNFRAKVQEMKKELINESTCKFSINPKIDSKNQRRLQCGIGFNTLFEEFGLDSSIIGEKELWGESLKLSQIPLN